MGTAVHQTPRGQAAREASGTLDKPDEFMGPYGVAGTIIFLPLFCLYVAICLSAHAGQLFFPFSAEEAWQALHHIPRPTFEAWALYASWIGLQVILALFCPGHYSYGMPLQTKQKFVKKGGDSNTSSASAHRLRYKMNGFSAMVCTFSLWAAAVYLELISPTLLADQFGSLLAVAIVFAFTSSVLLFLLHKASMFGLREERCTGYMVYDFFMGGSINPRFGEFDIKFFCEGRPGLLLWALIDLSFAAKQYYRQGHVSLPLFLVLGAQLWYIVDYFWQEDAILTTMDIMHDKFGFMLCFGDLVWVPFLYSLQVSFLAQHPEIGMSFSALAAVCVVNAIGYWVFRTANNQKGEFRADPSKPIWGKQPRIIETKRGTPLLAGGLWGLSRHPNYLGDWLMGLCWCLPCGFTSLLPYFYAIYFAILLIHRERRDNARCNEKYGQDWKRYCTVVPHRIVPYMY